MMTIIVNGGKHADNNVDFQEFMIQPWGFANLEDGFVPAVRDLSQPQDRAAR